MNLWIKNIAIVVFLLLCPSSLSYTSQLYRPVGTHPSPFPFRQTVIMLARRRLGLKSHSRSSPVTGSQQGQAAARESFRTSGIHEYPRCPANSANGGGRCSVQSHRAAAFFLAAHSSSAYLIFTHTFAALGPLPARGHLALTSNTS